MPAKKKRFISEKVAEYPPGHWSNTIRVGDHIWLSGFTARENDLNPSTEKTIRTNKRK